MNNSNSQTPNSQSLETCNMCGGNGELNCQRCEGTGGHYNSWGDIVDCPECGGNAVRECKHCKGTGKLKTEAVETPPAGGGDGPADDEAPNSQPLRGYEIKATGPEGSEAHVLMSGPGVGDFVQRCLNAGATSVTVTYQPPLTAAQIADLLKLAFPGESAETKRETKTVTDNDEAKLWWEQRGLDLCNPHKDQGSVYILEEENYEKADDNDKVYPFLPGDWTRREAREAFKNGWTRAANSIQIENFMRETLQRTLQTYRQGRIFSGVLHDWIAEWSPNPDGEIARMQHRGLIERVGTGGLLIVTTKGREFANAAETDPVTR